jgi:hypothetical protein
MQYVTHVDRALQARCSVDCLARKLSYKLTSDNFSCLHRDSGRGIPQSDYMIRRFRSLSTGLQARSLTHNERTISYHGRRFTIRFDPSALLAFRLATTNKQRVRRHLSDPARGKLANSSFSFVIQQLLPIRIAV